MCEWVTDIAKEYIYLNKSSLKDIEIICVFKNGSSLSISFARSLILSLSLSAFLAIVILNYSLALYFFALVVYVVEKSFYTERIVSLKFWSKTVMMVMTLFFDEIKVIHFSSDFVFSFVFN